MDRFKLLLTVLTVVCIVCGFALQSCSNDSVEENHVSNPKMREIVPFDTENVAASVSLLYPKFYSGCSLEGLTVTLEETKTRSAFEENIVMYKFQTEGNKEFYCTSEKISDCIYKTTIRVGNDEFPFCVKLIDSKDGVSFEYVDIQTTRSDLSERASRWMPCMQAAMGSHIGVIIAVSGTFGFAPVAAEIGRAHV